MTRRRWVDYSRLSSLSPSMPPEYPNELLFLHDKHFELNGEIMMFVLVAVFSLFILFLVLLPCLKRSSGQESGQESEHSGSVTRQKCPLPWRRKQRRMEDVTPEGRMDDVTPEGSVLGESEVSRRFPQLGTSA
ncbi:hypothetical protein FH972_011737 [Carpinus fangiana]|uniref:Uncharacterized protein n=1 Tax=Carpinus fangiana TaxID=176857 RepID=A0A660KS76_9ROSI|nr:hypothetical protein FH972_011737 [Carpinus fangiana]